MRNKRVLVIVTFSVVFLITLAIYCNVPYINASRLVKAIKAEDVDKVQQLLELGIDPNITTTSDMTEVILNLVESTGERPLSVACRTGNLEIVKLLVKYGATAEPYDKCGWSPLNQVFLYYQPVDKEIVKLLLENGADINENDAYGIPIFNAAAMLPKKHVRQENDRVFYVDGYDEEVAKGITDIVKMLLEYGDYDVNLKSSYHDTTLLIAASKSGNRHLVEYLLSKDCDITEKDKSNKTALYYAETYEYTEIVTMLQEK